jgi:SMI1 / KNR4 family (SUKH-1)
MAEALVKSLRSLCVLCASAVNEAFLTSPSKLTRSSGCGSAALHCAQGGKSRMQEKHITTSDWESFLDKWNRELLDRLDPTQYDYSSLFRESGFLYASIICGRLKDGKDQLSRYLVSQLDPATRRLLEQYIPPNLPDSELGSHWVTDAAGYSAPPNKPGPALLKALVDDLNRLLQGPLLYDEERFKGIQLSEKAKSLIEKNPSGESLVRLNRILMDDAYPNATGRNHDHLVETDISPEVIASGWLGYPGATEDQIAGLEARLGRSLPPSYRAFLKVSNGFRQPGMMSERILSTDEVEWFPIRHQGLVDICNSNYLEYLLDTLVISIQHIDGEYFYLLNPNVVTANGEWEAINFTWVGGENQYPSFWDLMQREYRYSVFWAERRKWQLHREDDPQMIIVKFPYLIQDLERKIGSLVDNHDPSNPDWSNDALQILKAAKSRVIEIGEKGDQPEAILQQLRALVREFMDISIKRRQFRMEANIYRHDRRDGIEDGYYMAQNSIMWFLNDCGRAAP